MDTLLANDSPRLLTTEEAASILDVAPETLVTWRARRRGPPYVKMEGGKVRYLLSDIHAYIQASTINPSERA
jgi:predicted DNA-binding transcriptional regulator AlpA